MPVLAICRGMQLLNVAFGGRLIQDVPGHRSEWNGEKWEPNSHSICISPGSKAAAIIGSAGFFKVNSIHHQGLKEAQRAHRLMTTAYSVEDFGVATFALYEADPLRHTIGTKITL